MKTANLCHIGASQWGARHAGKMTMESGINRSFKLKNKSPVMTYDLGNNTNRFSYNIQVQNSKNY